jgi:CDP-diglyceride synthetase
MNKAMVKRIIFGTAMTAVVLFVIWLDFFLQLSIPAKPETEIQRNLLIGLPILVVICALLVVGMFEINTMARAAGTRLLFPAGIVGVVLIAAMPKIFIPYTIVSMAPHVPTFWESLIRILEYNPLLMPGIVVVGVFLNQMFTRRAEGALSRIAATLLAVTYLGVCGAMILSLRMTYGLGVLLVFLGAVKLTDVGAYFVGSLIGKHKIIPWLSPGKSWEGLIGGLILAGLTGWFSCWMNRTFSWFDFSLSLPKAIAFCLILGVVGQFGDLCESLLKRSAGVKDAGNLVPQFGGVLDILDSPLIAAPIAHVLLVVLGNLTVRGAFI